jgi:hypothetical protein
MNMRKQQMIVFIILAFLVSSCGSLTPSKEPERTPPSAPKAGMATIIGRVVSRDSGEPIVGKTVWLAEVYRQGEEGAFVLDEAFSPTALPDENGYFIFENVPAKEYVIVIGNYNAEYDIPEESGTTRPMIFNLQAGNILDVGEIRAKLEFHP